MFRWFEVCGHLARRARRRGVEGILAVKGSYEASK